MYITRIRTEQYAYTLLLQKGPHKIKQLQASPYCYCRSSSSEQAVDPHLFAGSRTEAALLHHHPPEAKVGLQTLESCSTSSVTTHQLSDPSIRPRRSPSLAPQLPDASPAPPGRRITSKTPRAEYHIRCRREKS